MKNFLKNFVADESGASAAEYALILVVIGVGLVVAANRLGDAIVTGMNNAAEVIETGEPLS